MRKGEFVAVEGANNVWKTFPNNQKEWGVRRMEQQKWFAFLLMVLLLWLTTGAVAEVPLEPYFSGYAQLEAEFGEYDSSWPVDAKIQLVALLLENGRDLPDRTKAETLTQGSLNEQEADRMASQIIEGYFQGALAMNTYNIMQKELGQMEEWSYEENALYCSLLTEYGNWNESWDLFLLPQEGDIPYQDAKESAIQTLCAKFDVRRETLEASNVSSAFYSKEGTQHSADPIWHIDFLQPDAYSGRYCVELSRTGDVLTYSGPGTLPFDGDDWLKGAVEATPGPNDASAKQVIQTTRNAASELGKHTEREIDAMRAEARFLYHERFCNGWEPVWLVSLYADEELCYKGLCGYDGSYIDTVTGDKEFGRTLRFGLFIEEELGVSFESFHFWEMTHEERAAFSNEWNPVIDAYLETHPYYTNRSDWLIDVTRHVYGIPSNRDISQEQAENIACQAAVQLGANADTMGNRTIECYFDITDSQQHKWNVFIGHALDLHDFSCFKVVIDAQTEEVLDSFEITTDMIPADYRM